MASMGRRQMTHEFTFGFACMAGALAVAVGLTAGGQGSRLLWLLAGIASLMGWVPGIVSAIAGRR